MTTATEPSTIDPSTTAHQARSGAPPTRPRRARGEGDQLRVELLDAAAELMGETGDLESISLRSIAKRAGVSPTAVYRHFDDHISLLHAAVDHCWLEFNTQLASAVSPDDDPFTQIRSAGDAYVDFAMSQPGKYRVLFSNNIDLGWNDPDDVGGRGFGFLVALVTAVLDARGDDRDPWFVAKLIHTWIHGIVDLCGRHTDFDWPDTSVLLDELAARLEIDAPGDVAHAEHPGDGATSG